MPPTRTRASVQTVSALTGREPSLGASGDSVFCPSWFRHHGNRLDPAAVLPSLWDVSMAGPGWQAPCSAERSADRTKPGRRGFNAGNEERFSARASPAVPGILPREDSLFIRNSVVTRSPGALFAKSVDPVGKSLNDVL